LAAYLLSANKKYALWYCSKSPVWIDAPVIINNRFNGKESICLSFRPTLLFFISIQGFEKMTVLSNRNNVAIFELKHILYWVKKQVV
jgi:hypothetical protein